MKLIWIENSIDQNYINKLTKRLSKVMDFKIFYRPTKCLYDNFDSYINENPSTKFSSITEVLRFIQSKVEILVTGYNLNKYNSKYFENTKLILLGHSHLGPVRYNNVAYLNHKMKNTLSIIPSYYVDLFPGKIKKSVLSECIQVKNYYKNDYHIDNPPKVEMTDSILLLPHWSTSIDELESLVKKLRNSYPSNKIIIKFHPNVKVELIKTKKYLLGTKIGDTGSVGKAKSLLNEFINKMKDEYNCYCYYEDELSLLDAIDQSGYLVFDGASSSLVESMIRNHLYFNDSKKFLLYQSNCTKELTDKVNEIKKENPNISSHLISNKIINDSGLRNWINYGDLEMISDGYKISITSNSENNFKGKFTKINSDIINKIIVDDGKSSIDEIIEILRDL